MPRKRLTAAEWRRSLERRRMLDAERKRRLREDSAYRVMERARNREARRRQRENPIFREAERVRAHAYYAKPECGGDSGVMHTKVELESEVVNEPSECVGKRFFIFSFFRYD
ncbi:unnamed protein product [Gongylonema pulchrum]|uniref:IBB domain-containing protein n=1 Tax=Gongylonema pulchrum TaxID=637853 RepID=A0A183E668_9BILA|nr:unnamed protein product [Gongylonema pulchrum]